MLQSKATEKPTKQLEELYTMAQLHRERYAVGLERLLREINRIGRLVNSYTAEINDFDLKRSKQIPNLRDRALYMLHKATGVSVKRLIELPARRLFRSNGSLNVSFKNQDMIDRLPQTAHIFFDEEVTNILLEWMQDFMMKSGTKTINRTQYLFCNTHPKYLHDKLKNHKVIEERIDNDLLDYRMETQKIAVKANKELQSMKLV